MSEVQTAYNRGVQEGKAETESAVEKAKEEANEQNQANIDDLFACLGEVRMLKGWRLECEGCAAAENALLLIVEGTTGGGEGGASEEQTGADW